MKLLPKLAALAGSVVLAIMVVRWLKQGRKKAVVSPYNPPVESYKPVVDITV